MSVGTTRLNLTKPGGGSTGLITPPDPADIDVLNANFDKIDDSIGFKNVTSATRPASPYDGQPILESDTGLIAIYRATGTLWQYPNTTPVIADLNALPSASLFEGRSVHVDSMNVDFQAQDNVWVQQGTARFATIADANTEYAKAAGAYKISTALIRIVGEMWDRRWSTVGAGRWAPYGGGASLLPVKPTAVSGTGVSIGVDGAVIFTNTAAMNVDGFGSVDFEDYVVKISVSATNATAGLTAQMRAAGVAYSAANQTSVGVETNVGLGPTRVSSTTSTTLVFGRVGNVASGGAGFSEVVLRALNLAERTFMRQDSRDYDGYLTQYLGIVPTTTQYDGFSLGTGGPLITGKLTIHGVVNNN